MIVALSLKLAASPPCDDDNHLHHPSIPSYSFKNRIEKSISNFFSLRNTLKKSNESADLLLIDRSAMPLHIQLNKHQSLILLLFAVRLQALLGHTDGVTCLTASSAYRIVVSGSRDRTCIIWDLNKLSFVTQLRGHRAPVSALCINELTVGCEGRRCPEFSVRELSADG